MNRGRYSKTMRGERERTRKTKMDKDDLAMKCNYFKSSFFLES